MYYKYINKSTELFKQMMQNIKNLSVEFYMMAEQELREIKVIYLQYMLDILLMFMS